METKGREAVSKIRRLMEDSLREKKSQDAVVAFARRQFPLCEFNAELLAINPSPRARQLRAVARMVAWYSWAAPEVGRFLDDHDSARVGDLTDDQITELTDRLTRLDDCARNGLDSPDAPVAR